jgi:RNA polymerase sigma-70 factor, ECF subfamily
LRLLRRGWPELDAHQRKSYLYKTAHSALVDHYRARQRETRWRAEQPTIGDPNARRLCVGLEDGSPDALLELPDDMRRVFDTLTARQRSLLWLAYVEGFKHDEIAAVLGVTASSVRVLLSRARAELAAKLSSQSLAPIAARGVER